MMGAQKPQFVLSRACIVPYIPRPDSAQTAVCWILSTSRRYMILLMWCWAKMIVTLSRWQGHSHDGPWTTKLTTSVNIGFSPKLLLTLYSVRNKACRQMRCFWWLGLHIDDLHQCRFICDYALDTVTTRFLCDCSIIAIFVAASLTLKNRYQNALDAYQGY